QPGDPVLWNPRQEPRETHFLSLADGSLYPITEVGRFTIERLRLNRPPLVANRQRKQTQVQEFQLLTRYRNLLALLEEVYRQQAILLEEHRALLEEQRALLRLLRGKE